MGKTILIKSAGVSTATGLEKFRSDPVLRGDSGGVQFLFDFPSVVGWPDQDAPISGDVIPNLATLDGLMEFGDGAFSLAAAQTVNFSGGGFAFTGLTAGPAEVVGPAGALTSIHDATNDYFLVTTYLKFPASGDWNTDATIAPFFACTTSASGYATPEVDMLLLAMSNAPTLNARRQTNGGSTVVQLNISSLTEFYDKVCQVACWRNASGFFMRVKSSTGEQSASAAVGSNNSGDFSAKQPRWGVASSFNNLAAKAAHRATHKTRLYRGWVEDLSLSGRNPLTVLDADWTRVQQRIADSAAANGGTSLIFV